MVFEGWIWCLDVCWCFCNFLEFVVLFCIVCWKDIFDEFLSCFCFYCFVGFWFWFDCCCSIGCGVDCCVVVLLDDLCEDGCCVLGWCLFVCDLWVLVLFCWGCCGDEGLGLFGFVMLVGLLVCVLIVERY